MLRSPSSKKHSLTYVIDLDKPDAPSTLVWYNSISVSAARAPISGGIVPVYQRAAAWLDGVRLVYIIMQSALCVSGNVTTPSGYFSSDPPESPVR